MVFIIKFFFFSKKEKKKKTRKQKEEQEEIMRNKNTRPNAREIHTVRKSIPEPILVAFSGW